MATHGGMSSMDVKEIQATLNRLGIRDKNGNKLVVDGYFGPLTDSSVRNFQTQNGLMVDGIVGPQTRGAFSAQEPDFVGAGNIYKPEHNRQFMNELPTNAPEWVRDLWRANPNMTSGEFRSVVEAYDRRREQNQQNFIFPLPPEHQRLTGLPYVRMNPDYFVRAGMTQNDINQLIDNRTKTDDLFANNMIDLFGLLGLNPATAERILVALYILQNYDEAYARAKLREVGFTESITLGRDYGETGRIMQAHALAQVGIDFDQAHQQHLMENILTFDDFAKLFGKNFIDSNTKDAMQIYDILKQIFGE